MAYDLKVNGTSIRTLVTVASWDGVFASGPLRGSNGTVPGVAGDFHQPKVRAAYAFTVQATILGTSEGNFQDRLDALRVLCDSSAAALTLVRTRPLGSADVTSTCLADYLDGLEPSMVNMQTGRVALTFINLSGSWT